MKKPLVPRIEVLTSILFALTVVTLPPPSYAQQQKADFMIVNRSEWDIYHLYLSPTQKDKWGPDQLGDKIIKNDGGSFTLYNIPCGHYDIKIVNDDDETCIVEDVIICKDHTHRDITNTDLAECERAGEQNPL